MANNLSSSTEFFHCRDCLAKLIDLDHAVLMDWHVEI